MTSHYNRRTSKATPAWLEPAIATATSVPTGQVVRCGTHTIRRKSMSRQPANPLLRHQCRWKCSVTGDLAIRNTGNYDQPEPLRSSGVTGVPDSSSAFDISSSGRYRGRRWRGALPYRVSRAA